MNCSFSIRMSRASNKAGYGPSPSIASRKPAHRPVTQDAGSAPH
eukprot:CAMPEP_0172626582 /NCGR_PEP_ID=MMETSP1068-20121228/151155_1 /TAXON_ID=35684 /ORGANISM="Pseudopedinella elastica, Strain CCMP716" /LENGTH=43 /DNA_ID= /DNA_START= /DNA_END= /DNA_ORIENTATION=